MPSATKLPDIDQACMLTQVTDDTDNVPWTQTFEAKIITWADRIVL